MPFLTPIYLWWAINTRLWLFNYQAQLVNRSFLKQLSGVPCSEHSRHIDVHPRYIPQNQKTCYPIQSINCSHQTPLFNAPIVGYPLAMTNTNVLHILLSFFIMLFQRCFLQVSCQFPFKLLIFKSCHVLDDWAFLTWPVDKYIWGFFIICSILHTTTPERQIEGFNPKKWGCSE